MPISGVANVVQLILQGTCVTEETLNVFYYGSATNLDGLPAFIAAWIAAVMTTLQSAVGTSTLYSEVSAQGERGVTSFATQPISLSGFVSGDQLPPFATWDFTYVRGGALERNGYKRFSGIPESFQQNGVATGSGPGQVAALATVLNQDIPVVLDTWFPLIRRTKVHRLAQIPPVYYDKSSVVYSKIGSQNSRKFGHGR